MESLINGRFLFILMYFIKFFPMVNKNGYCFFFYFLFAYFLKKVIYPKDINFPQEI